jgi:hypothetical protein
MAFPWPVTDDELLLSNALTKVMNALGDGGRDKAQIREKAARFILDVHNKGVRDEEILAAYATRTLFLSLVKR